MKLMYLTDPVRFYILLTVFQLYQGDGRVIMKGVQWNSIYEKIFASKTFLKAGPLDFNLLSIGGSLAEL